MPQSRLMAEHKGVPLKFDKAYFDMPPFLQVDNETSYIQCDYIS